MSRRLSAFPTRIAAAAAGLSLALAVSACQHTDPEAYRPAQNGPFVPGAETRLTYDLANDNWPMWTSDGRGILYSYGRLGADIKHRCIGLLPASGGTQLWQMCDDRVIMRDSASSFGAFALHPSGKLLYVEAVSGAVVSTPNHTILWVADSASPFNRTAELSLPQLLNGTAYSWLSDLAWTGDASYIALAQDLTLEADCDRCVTFDTAYYHAGVVVTGVLGTHQLHALAGTEGATSYAITGDSTGVVFTKANDLHLHRVPLGGGTDSIVAALPGSGSSAFTPLGVSCRGVTCVVTLANVAYGVNNSAGFLPGTNTLVAVSMPSGATQIIKSTAAALSLARISPTSGVIVAQIGGTVGHIKTSYQSYAYLYLYQALLP